MSIAEKKRMISRSNFRSAFKENNPIVPGTAQKLFSFEERMKMEKTLFRKKVGGVASASRFKKVIAEKTPNSKADFFGKRGYLTRSEFRERLQKASPFTKGFSGMMKRKERIKLEKEVFGKRYGHFIERRDYSKAIKDLRRAKAKAKTDTEKRKIRRNIRFLKDLGGL